MANTKQPAVRAAVGGILIALAMVLSYVETIIPVSIAFPGIKLGLANLVTLVGLYCLGIRDTIVVSLLRIVLVSITFGNMAAFLYSFGGWSFSMATMVVVRKKQWMGTVGVGVTGGVTHNIGQIVMAAWILRQPALILSYLPVLLIAGTIAGMIVGLLGAVLVSRIAGIKTKL